MIRVARVPLTMNVNATGNGRLEYQWRQDQTPLSDGPNVTGSQSATLSLLYPTESNQGYYDVLVTDDACTQISTRTFLRILDPDIDHDGQVGVLDLLTVLNHWHVYCGSNSNPCPGDVDEDRYVSSPDLLLVLMNWSP